MGPGPCTLVLSRELTERVIFVFVFVCAPTCQDGVSVCEYAGAPFPMAHTGRPDVFSSVCLVPAFCQVVRFGTLGSVLFSCLCLHTSQLASASLFGVSLLTFSSQMEQHQNVRQPTGTTELNLLALHSVQQLQDGTSSTSVQPLAPAQETDGRPQALYPAHSYHAVPSAHQFLRAPLALSQAKQYQLCSMRPSRSFHSSCSYSNATS